MVNEGRGISELNKEETELKTIITYELNHFIEVSKIEDKKYRYPNYNKVKKSLIF